MMVGRIVAVLAVAAMAVLVWLAFNPSEDVEPEEGVATDVAVQVGALERRTLHRYVTLYGVAEPEPAQNGVPGAGAHLAPATPGLVAEVLCSEGQHVEAGQILVRLDTRVTDVRIQRAREQVAFAELRQTRQQKLLDIEGTSQKALQEVEQDLRTAKRELDAALAERGFLETRAPFAGIVARIDAHPGESVDLTSTLVELVDPSRMVITAGVPAGEIAGVSAGSPVELLDAGAPHPRQGKVTFVSPQLDPATGTAMVRVSGPPGEALLPGQYVNFRIVSEERRDRLAAPAGSVVRNEDGEMVIAVVEGDRAVQRPVRTGLRDDAWIEVEGDGLEEGTRVVTVGAYGLPRETRVHVVGR